VRTFEVVCIENIGMEDSFLVGVSYLGEWGSDGMLNVIDRGGVKRECYADRFELLEPEDMVIGVDFSSGSDKTAFAMHRIERDIMKSLARIELMMK